MKRIKNIDPRILHWLEWVLAAFIPFIIWRSLTPTNVLNSGFLFGLLERVGFAGSTLVFFGGIPMGILGIRKAKELEKRRVLMTAVSSVNLSAGIIEVGCLIIIFCAAVFGGVSV